MIHTSKSTSGEYSSKPGMARYALFLVFLCLAVVAYQDVAVELLRYWDRDDYSYAYFVPVLMGWIFWTDRQKIWRASNNRPGFAYGFLVATVLLYTAGTFSAIVFFSFLSLYLCLLSLVFFIVGNGAFKTLWAFMLTGFFALPLPAFVFRTVSFELRLISSWLAEIMLNVLNITVYREGNLIDLGTIQLEVVDACSGLRYLLPSLLMAVLIGWMFLRRPLLRAILILAAIPIAVFSNAFRLMVTGVLCKYIGPEMAEGFFHDFSGWLVYMVALSCLFYCIYLLRRKDSPLPGKSGATVGGEAPPPGSFGGRAFLPGVRPLCALVMVFCCMLAAREWSASPAGVPERESFASFPLSIGQWIGTKQVLSPEVLDSLAATDAFHAMYTSDDKTYQILLLLVYYEKQDSIAAAHAPTSCLLGSGWSITQKAEREPSEAFPYPMAWMLLRHSGNSLISNFWFQQRGRYISNELMNKWHLFTDSFTMRRTDGALVRLELVHTASMTTEQGQKILDAFAKEMHLLLPRFIPGKQTARAVYE